MMFDFQRAVSVCSVVIVCLFALPTLVAAPEPWFGDLEPNASPSAALVDQFSEAVFRAMKRGGDVEFSGAPKGAAIVFLSASDGYSAARVAVGSGTTATRAANVALLELRRRMRGRTWRWLRVDWVAGPIRKLTLRRELKYDRTLLGLAFPKSTGVAFLPDEVVAHTIVSSDQLYLHRKAQEAVRIRRGIPETLELEKPESVWVFGLRSRFHDGTGNHALFRGHRVRSEPSADFLKERAIAAGDYLVRATMPNGKFVYSYLPKTDTVADSYNLVRHAGTIYSMLELYEVTRDAELLEAAKRAIDYLELFLRPFGPDGSRMQILLSSGKIKLGGVALVIVALAKFTEVTGDNRHVPAMGDLARYLRNSQKESGEFISQRFFPSGRARTDFVSQYYPGEAILALVRLYAIDRQELWIDTAERAARFL
ncbi:MAG: hypothetical protein AAF488_07040, partial [Planctomycetota bacterium]